jgi:hypothetical protein
MEQGHPRTVNEGDTREIQGKSPTFGESLITARTNFVNGLANDLAFYEQGHSVACRLSYRYPYHLLHTLGTLSVMQVKSQFIPWHSAMPQRIEHKAYK